MKKRAARRATGAAVLTLALALTAAACRDSDDVSRRTRSAAPPKTVAEKPPVETEVTFGKVTGRAGQKPEVRPARDLRSPTGRGRLDPRGVRRR